MNAQEVLRIDARNNVDNITAGSVGVVRAPSVADITSTGDIASVSVVNWNQGNSPSDYTGTVRSTSGSVGAFDLNGNAKLLGSVTADQGSIGTVSAVASIGPASGSPATIRAKNGITSIIAPSLNANIDSRFNSGTGSINTLTTTSGEFIGSLQTVGIGASLRVASNLGANLTITGPLTKNIVANSANVGGAWSGSATVNGASLSPLPAYATTNSSLGGGSVGLVPFRAHAPQSDALNANLVSSQFSGLAPQPRRPLIVEFYGPIAAGASGSPARVIIPLDPTNVCYPITPSGIDVTARCDITVSQSNPRQLLINVDQDAELPGATYIVVPAVVPNLFCANIGGGSVPVADFLYEFAIAPDCNNDGIADPSGCGNTGYCDPIDFNNDGVFPDLTDVVDFFNVFEGGTCSTGNCNDIDFNNDGVFPDLTDLQAFLDTFAGGCLFCAAS